VPLLHRMGVVVTVFALHVVSLGAIVVPCVVLWSQSLPHGGMAGAIVALYGCRCCCLCAICGVAGAVGTIVIDRNTGADA
jgi:hypothetical protein